MFRHVVLITWKPDATEAQKGAVADELGKLPAVIVPMKLHFASAVVKPFAPSGHAVLTP